MRRHSCAVAFHLGEVFSCVVLERGRQQRFFAVEVIVDEAVGHPETLGDIRHTRASKTAFDDHFAGGFKDLNPPGLDRVLFHDATIVLPMPSVMP
jgi:hypothetical protein